MTQNIVLINNITDFDVIPDDVLLRKNLKIFSFGLDVHEKLKSKNLPHEIADDLLSNTELIQLFKKSIHLRSWQSQILMDDFKFKGVNLLKIFDTNEFHTFLISNLIKYITIKRILDNERPTKIISTNSLSSIIKNLNKNNFETLFFNNKEQKNFFWDKINIKYNFGILKISFSISKNNYLKIKKFIDFITTFLSQSYFEPKNNQKTIILLEFNTELFSKLLRQFKNYNGTLLLVNQRRPAIWSKKSFSIIKNSNCKIVNFDKIIDKKDKESISQICHEYSLKIEKFFNSDIFDQFFQIENQNFWNIIKDDVIQSYLKKLPNFINLILCVNKIFENIDLRCIVSLNQIGETEKTFLEFNNKKISTILLEHGFNETVPETEIYHKHELIEFDDKIAVWGLLKKNDLIEKFNVESNKILITGSPRHDEYFNSRLSQKFSEEITVLLAPNPITDFSGLKNTALELKFKNTIENLIIQLQQFKNVKIIVKLHQIQLEHNQKIKSIISTIDKRIKIHSSESVIGIINQSNVVIVITPEKFGTSTMLMESMILGKPTMNIILDDTIPQFPHVIKGAILAISSESNLETHLKKFLFDKDFQNELIKNADDFLKQFLANQTNSSEKFASILKSY